MAEASHNQGTTRYVRPRCTATIRSLESNIAELIAQDMRQLELQDAAEEATKTASSDVPEPGRETPDTVHNSSTHTSTITEGTALETVNHSSTHQSTITEGTRDISTEPSRDRAPTGDGTTETNRSSWRERFSGDESIDESRRRPWTENLNRSESSNETTYSTWRDRLSREERSDDIEIPLRANLIGDESPREYVAGSYRRGSWRERLGREVSTPEAPTYTRESISSNASPQEYTPGSYRRGSWRERLGMVENTPEVSTVSRVTPRTDDVQPQYTSGLHRRGSWRDRLGMTESISEVSTLPRVTTRTDDVQPQYTEGLNRRGSWRERLGMAENTPEVSTLPRVTTRTDEVQPQYTAGSIRRGSWRERFNREENTDEVTTSVTDVTGNDDNTKAYVPYVPGAYRRGSWRERLRRDENTPDTSSRPWRDRLARLDYTSGATNDSGNDSLRREVSSPSITGRTGLSTEAAGSWRERLEREENHQATSRNSPVQVNTSQQLNSLAADRPSVVNNVPAVENNSHLPDTVNGVNNEDAVSDGESPDVHAHNASQDRDTTAAAESEIKKAEARSWTTEDVLKLLVKAINYRSPLKDILTILRWEFDTNMPHKNGLRALHYAAYANYVNCVEILLQKGANINITDDIGYTPLHLAARCGHYDTIEKLIENGAMITFNEPGVEIRRMDEVNKLGFTTTEPVNLAIQNYHPECAELLLKNGARADNRYFMGPEIVLAPNDGIKGIEVLLKYGANPNVFNRCGMCPLMKACKDHRIDLVRLLLQHGADYNIQCPPLFEQKSVLQIAIESGNIVIVNLLLFKNPKMSRNDNYNFSALHTAIVKGRADICRLLLQKGANPEERTEAGATPLMLVCSTEGIKERKEIVQMLLNCGAEVNAYGENFSYVDPYLSPIAEYFKNIGHSESFSIVETLISNGARIHYTTGDVLLGGRRDPFAILHFAHCMMNAPDIFELTLAAAKRFNPLHIHVCDSLPEEMKTILLIVATQPSDLKQIVRMALREMLMPDLVDNVMDLPLPELIKSYILFK